MAQFHLTQAAEPRPGFIYVLAEKTSSGGYTGYYKVGKTQDLVARRSELQTGNPHELVYVWTVEVSDMDAAERLAHDTVRRDHRSNEKGGKEWYYQPPAKQQDFLLKIQLMVGDKYVKKYRVTQRYREH